MQTIREQTITIEGMPIRYFAAGDGPPLLLLHGNGDSKFSWSWVIPALARTHRVYAPDLPGFGDSAKPIRAYSSDFFARFVAAFMDALGVGRAAVVGSSFGGLVAARLALAAPGRVASLALVDSAGLGVAINPLLAGLALPGWGDFATLWGKTAPGARQRALTRATLTFARPNRAPSTWIAEQDRLGHLPGFTEATVAVLRSLVGPYGQRDLVLGQLGRLPMPTLVLWGSDDRLFPVYQARAAAARLRRGRLAVIPDCGHIPHVEQPDAFVDILGRFLAARPAAPIRGRAASV